MPSSSSGVPCWVPVADAADQYGIPRSTMRRWASQGRVPARRMGPRKLQVDLAALEQMTRPAVPARRHLTEADEELARAIGRALLPLTEEQKERLSLLLCPGARRGAA